MAEACAIPNAITAPVVTAADLQAFQREHFGATCISHFTAEYLEPVAENDRCEPCDEGDSSEDDGLGYYDDGVKRTLTDEQIAIFRHSEIEALGREKRRVREREEYPNGSVQNDSSSEEDRKDGPDEVVPTTQASTKDDESHVQDLCNSLQDSKSDATDLSHAIPDRHTTKKRKRTKGQSTEPKPDLRKRTWDVVEEGLDDLDYG